MYVTSFNKLQLSLAVARTCPKSRAPVQSISPQKLLHCLYSVHSDAAAVPLFVKKTKQIRDVSTKYDKINHPNTGHIAFLSMSVHVSPLCVISMVTSPLLSQILINYMYHHVICCLPNQVIKDAKKWSVQAIECIFCRNAGPKRFPL